MSFFKDYIFKKLGDNSDLVCREINTISGKVFIIFFKSTTDKNAIAEQIIKPILEQDQTFTFSDLTEKIISSSEAVIVSLDESIEKILRNQVVIIFNGNALALDLEKVPTRMPQEPPTSPNIFGPREGFVESSNTNLAMLRKRLPSENLVICDLFVGSETKTKVSVMYLKNIAKSEIVEEVKKRIENINIDGVVDSYYIAEFLKKKPKSMFEQTGFQEKPDIVIAKMLEGRIAIVVDGSPIVITVPYMVFEDLQSSNDYYTNHIYVNFVRIIRTFGILLATIIPGLYIYIRLYGYSLIPLNYSITLANSTKNLPFTPVLEIIFIILLFQTLYEVSLRLPQYLGLATSIVGALVLGDTGVKAGLISPPGVIIIAVSIMAIYTIPAQASQLTILRAVFVVLGATAGLFGIIAGIIYIINYLNTLNFYDTPYLAPFSPKIGSDLKDGLIKKPLSQMTKRPKSIGSQNVNRQRSSGNDKQ